MKIKKNLTLFAALLFFVFSIFSMFNISRAEDDEEDDDRETRTVETSTTPAENGKPKVETTTETITKTIVLGDRDGDGILDGVDPHPDVAEIYIVEDKNNNGIVDKFEK